MPIKNSRITAVCRYCGKEFQTYPSQNTQFCSQPHYAQWQIGRSRGLSEVERFWAKVDVRGPDECWPWLGQIKGNGYGTFPVSDGNGRWRKEYAHRYSYNLAHPDAPLPDGLNACHNCPEGDRRDCVNPRHLWPGTVAENQQDASEKGRLAHGSAHKHSRLTEVQVIEIRAKYAGGGIGCWLLAREFGVCAETIHRIVNRKAWKHVP